MAEWPASRTNFKPDRKVHWEFIWIPVRTERYTLAETTTGTTSASTTPGNDKLYKSEYVGSGTFIISKPKRSKTKMRQSALKNVRRGSRK